jgi:hypothetical protein
MRRRSCCRGDGEVAAPRGEAISEYAPPPSLLPSPARSSAAAPSSGDCARSATRRAARSGGYLRCRTTESSSGMMHILRGAVEKTVEDRHVALQYASPFPLHTES